MLAYQAGFVLVALFDRSCRAVADYDRHGVASIRAERSPETRVL